MRRVHRQTLELEVRRELLARQRGVTPGTARDAWASFRASKKSIAVVAALGEMAGKRERCMYCSDSRGADVEHYLPIAVSPETTFQWTNLLWICPACNRGKNKRFPRNAQGDPLLIDPSKVDPWKHLILDTASGLIAARWIGPDWDELGKATLDVIAPLNHEAVIEGRARMQQRLRGATAAVLADNDRESRSSLLALAHEDDTGVSGWFAAWEGSRESPFAELRGSNDGVWRRFVKVVLAA